MASVLAIDIVIVCHSHPEKNAATHLNYDCPVAGIFRVIGVSTSFRVIDFHGIFHLPHVQLRGLQSDGETRLGESRTGGRFDLVHPDRVIWPIAGSN